MRWWIRRPSRRCTRAVASGVRIDLIVRGVCALRPGIPGVSENITRALGRRPLPRALARLLVRERRLDQELYLASADWMERNFFRRVEVAFPVLRQEHARAHLQGSRDLSGGQHQRLGIAAPTAAIARVTAGNASACDAQALLLERYAGVS